MYSNHKKVYSEVLYIKNLANIITISRFICSVALLCTVPFSLLFWVLYGYCGISDFTDGLIARIMKQQSDFGAKLDSIADTAFFFTIMAKIIFTIFIPRWVWTCVIVIIAIRVTAYFIGYKKYHTFSALHTYANKITGVFLYGTPALYAMFGITATGVILCLIAGFSACEELLITIRSKHLDRNCKGIFLR